MRIENSASGAGVAGVRSCHGERGLSRTLARIGASAARLALASALLLALPLGNAVAQTAPLHYEYDKKVDAAQSVGPLGADMFGDSTTGSTGQTVFSNIDIDIPGNNALPVRLGRRLVIDDRFLSEELGGIGNWDLDIPYIEGTFSKNSGWTVAPPASANRNARCSNPLQPYVEGGKFSAGEVWHGYHVYVPGSGTETMLADATGYQDPTDGITYPWTLKNMARLSCLPSLLNGYPGEGFVLRQTDGTKYTFNYPVERVVRRLEKGPNYQGYVIERKRVFLLATRVEDRFGNSVDYTYSAGKLTRILSSDGREILLTHGATSITATAGGKTWTYGITNGHLTSVTAPDLTKWQYSPFGALGGYNRPPDNPDLIAPEGFDPGYMCQTESLMRLEPRTFTVTHPSGATGTFSFQGKRFYRSEVAYRCMIDFFDHYIRVAQVNTNAGAGMSYTNIDWRAAASALARLERSQGYPPTDAQINEIVSRHTHHGVSNPPVVESEVEVGGHARIETSNHYDVYSLVSRSITGAGLAQETTAYSYLIEPQGYCNVFDMGTGAVFGTACGAPPCPACSETVGRWTEITDPSGRKTRLRYGIMYGKNEGVLLAEEIRNASGEVLRSTNYEYLSDAAAPSQLFRSEIGQRLTIDPMTSRMRPLVRQQIFQDGVTFTHQVEACGTRLCFDSLSRPIKVRKYSSLGSSRIEEVEFADNFSLWVLGQSRFQWINTLLASETIYDPKMMPTTIKSFGLTQQTIAWNLNGTPASLADGKGSTTRLSNWYRGIPQNITYPDETSISAVVDAFGRPTSVTDQMGSTTSYGYDAGGRINSIAYPTADTNSWTNTYVLFAKTTGTELGLSAGHWKQSVQNGNGWKITYFDARMRPQLVREYDAANVAGTDRYQAWDYNADGQVSFAAYPAASAGMTQGVWTEYDALGRTTSLLQDSEQGGLVTLTQYLDQFRTRVINPRGHATTTSYLVYDQPDTSLPLLIQSPEGLTTTITRTGMGQTYRLRRTGTAGGVYSDLSQFWVYDAHQRLCKAITFEGGATHFEYDAAGNVIRTADGDYTHTTDACTAGNIDITEKTVRTYDALNRIKKITYPDRPVPTLYDYFPDGKLQHVGDGDAHWWYNYNKRRLPIHEVLVSSAGTYEYRWTYDNLGHLASKQSFNSNGNPVFAFAPNALGQPTQAGAYATGATYHPNGALKGFSYGNGIQRSVTLNTRQLPLRVRDTLAGTARYDDSFGYDVNGNPTSVTDAMGQPGGTRTMAYDGQDRLTYANIVGSGVSTWSYDVLDNIRTHATSPSAGPAWSRSYNYDGSNRLTSITQNGAAWGYYTYDPRGNMINKTGQTLVFDRASRLTQMPNIANYEYDGHGRRTSQWRADGTVRVSHYTLDGKLQGEADNRAVGSTDYIYLGDTLVAKSFQHWSGIPPVVTYLHSDALGSPVMETNASGAVVSRERFLSYGGAVDGAVNDVVGYTGHQQDPASGLVYMQQRYYDPTIGQFLSIDSVSADPSSGRNFNRYRYGNNNPYAFVDPDGRNALTAFGGVIYETGQFLQGNGFDGDMVLGALKDGYNGEGDGFAQAAFDDATSFVPVGALAGSAIKLSRIVGAAIKIERVASFSQIRLALQSAQQAYKGSTRIGHSLSKHAGRNPDRWGKLTGSMGTWNAQAMRHAREIVRGPGSFQVVPNSNGVKFLEKTLEDGRGLRLNMDGSFKGFIDG